MYTIYKRTTPDGRVYIGKTTQTIKKELLAMEMDTKTTKHSMRLFRSTVGKWSDKP